jgi:muconolactone delta-isomerase
MQYLVVASTRPHCDLADPEVARAFADSYATLQERQERGTLKFAALSGPFTPMKTLLVIDVDSHEDAYRFITTLPAWTFMDNALYPLISLDTALESVTQLASE